MNSILEYRANYEPRAQVSPSRFKLARMCARADAFRYVAGIREREHKWDEVKLVPKPAATHDPKDKAAAKLHRERVAAWNRARRGPLGKECHRLIEAWYLSFVSSDHPQIDEKVWQTEPGRIVLAGLHLLPHPSSLAWWVTEEKIPLSFVHDITRGAHDYEFNAYIDLLATFKERDDRGCFHTVQDHKTTSSFDWMLTPAQLIDDTQGTLYPLWSMTRSGADYVVPRWTYFRTEDSPSARAVDFKVVYDGAKHRALKLFDEGAELVKRCVDRVDPHDVPGNVAMCFDFYHRTCIYHHSVGGPCKAEASAGARIKAALNTPEKREKIMAGFKKNKEAAGGSSANAGASSSAQSQSTEGAAGSEGASDGASDSSGEGAVDSAGGSDSGAQTGASAGGFKAGGAKRGPKPKAPVEGVGAVTITFETGATFQLPEASPLYAKLANIHAHLFGE